MLAIARLQVAVSKMVLEKKCICYSLVSEIIEDFFCLDALFHLLSLQCPTRKICAIYWASLDFINER